jgi:hypothetical protein
VTAIEIVLDCLDLEPPEPYERATEALRSLAPGTYLKLIVPRRPQLLYPWLRQHGFVARTLDFDPERCVVYACREGDRDALAAMATQG